MQEIHIAVPNGGIEAKELLNIARCNRFMLPVYFPLECVGKMHETVYCVHH